MAKTEEEKIKEGKKKKSWLIQNKVKNIFFTPRIIKETLVSIKISYISNASLR